MHSVSPILKRLATTWERTFQSHLPSTIKKHVENSIKLLYNFHEAIRERANSGVSLVTLSMLGTQFTNYEQFLQDLEVYIIDKMNELQREANRNFTPIVAEAMHDAYQQCVIDCGQGTYKRMKKYMEDHVERERHRMFDAAFKTVETELDHMCIILQQAMKAEADKISEQISTNYMRVINGIASNQPIHLPSKEEVKLRSEVRDTLSNIAVQLKRIAHGHVDLQDVAVDDTATSGDGSQARKSLHAYVENANMSDCDQESRDDADGSMDMET